MPSVPEKVFDALRAVLSGGVCPKPGDIGECAAVNFVCMDVNAGTHEVWIASLYIWDDGFNDSAAIADAILAAGASDAQVAHVLRDTDNGDVDGRTEDDARAWTAVFSFPAEGRKPDRASAAIGRPSAGQPPEGGDAAARTEG